jgi:hypothetical protein
LAAAAVLGAESALSGTVTQGWVNASLRFSDPRQEEVLAALEEGLAAEVHFQLRLYRRLQGRPAFMGDRLLAERRVAQTARYDRFAERYVIERQGRRVGEFSEPAAFLEAFCFLQEFPVGRLSGPPPAPSAAARHYLLGRVRLYPVRVVFPLSLITLFLPKLAVESRWLELELEQEL